MQLVYREHGWLLQFMSSYDTNFFRKCVTNCTSRNTSQIKLLPYILKYSQPSNCKLWYKYLLFFIFHVIWIKLSGRSEGIEAPLAYFWNEKRWGLLYILSSPTPQSQHYHHGWPFIEVSISGLVVVLLL